MKGRTRFTSDEAREIRELLTQKSRADRDGQKRIRGRIRKLGFYITDFSNAGDCFTRADFEALLNRGAISIIGSASPTLEPVIPMTPSRGGNRRDSDEAYMLDLCDEVLGRRCLRQHRFDFLLGDSGSPLPVDGYYPDLRLVIEYRERQHTEAVPFFDRRQTVSGVSRGEQRRIYDQRRRDVLGEQGITLLELSFEGFVHSARKRLLRDRERDLQALIRRLAPWVKLAE